MKTHLHPPGQPSVTACGRPSPHTTLHFTRVTCRTCLAKIENAILRNPVFNPDVAPKKPRKPPKKQHLISAAEADDAELTHRKC